MKYLFIVQGEGRGHMTQAIALSGMLRRNGHEIVGVLIGESKNRVVPHFFYEKIGAKVKTYASPSFLFSKDNKHIHIGKTILYNLTPRKLKKYMNSIELIHDEIARLRPDVVVNFYEMLAGFANLRFWEKTPFVSIGHQFLLKHCDYKFGHGDEQGLMFLRLHCLLSGLGARKTLALSFYPLKEDSASHIITVPPLLRSEVLEAKPSHKDFILGYILNSGFEEEVRIWHDNNPDTKLRFFWDKKDAPQKAKIDKTLSFYMIDDKDFIENMAACKAFISTAGFESICEAFYLDKPVMMIPAHIEQEINAADAESTGLGISGNKFDIGKLINFTQEKKTSNNEFRAWVDKAEEILIKHLTDF
ncbi:MAG: glycosyltransferase family protein [Dysgonomonas sp.]